MRSRNQFAILILVAVTLVTILFLWTAPVSRITEENFVRVQEGMSRAELEAILGPPGDYRTGPTVVTHPRKLLSTDPEAGHRSTTDRIEFDFARSWECKWESDKATVTVMFAIRFDEPDGNVQKHADESSAKVGVARYTRMTLEKGPLDNFLWRVQRQWRRWF